MSLHCQAGFQITPFNNLKPLQDKTIFWVTINEEEGIIFSRHESLQHATDGLNFRHGEQIISKAFIDRCGGQINSVWLAEDQVCVTASQDRIISRL